MLPLHHSPTSAKALYHRIFYVTMEMKLEPEQELIKDYKASPPGIKPSFWAWSKDKESGLSILVISSSNVAAFQKSWTSFSSSGALSVSSFRTGLFFVATFVPFFAEPFEPLGVSLGSSPLAALELGFLCFRFRRVCSF